MNCPSLTTSNKAVRTIIRVLYVDDDIGFLSVAKECLEAQDNFEVQTASSVNEAMDKLKKGKYDAVVSDYQIPGKDGLQFLEELRKSGNDIPFILFTGKGREEVAIQALNLGADGYINKQGSPETVYCELAHSVKSAVGLHKAEEALRSSEEKYRAYVENSPVAFFATDFEWKYEQVNEAACKLLGYPKEELLQMTTADVMFEEDTPLALKHYSQLDETGKSRVEFRLKRKDGEPVHVILNTVKLPNGKRIAFCEDITERKRAAEELRIQKEQLQAILDSLPLQIWYKDRNNRLVRVNKAFVDYMGVSKENLEGKPLCDLFPPDIAQKCWEEDKEVITTGQPKTDILDRHESAQGVRLFLSSKFPCSDQDGNIIGTINSTVDITERKKAEENLKESEERYRQLIEFAPDPIFTYDLNGRLLDCNRQAEKLTGFKKEELLGKDIFTSARSRSLIKIVPGQRTEPAEYELVSTDGSKFDVEISTFPVNRKGKVEIIAIGRDITESKKAEEALEKERQKLGCIIDSSPIIIFYKDKEGKFLRVNREFAKVLQMSQEDFVGKTVFDLYSTAIAQSMTNDDLEVLESGCPKLGVIEQYESASGLRWVQTDKVPILSENGVPNGIIGFAQDITGRKRAEEALEQRNLSLSVLNDVSNELASLPQNVTIPEYLVKKLRDITGALAVSFADYDSSKKTLIPLLLEVEPLWQDEVTRVLGKSLKDMRCPVSKKVYREIISSVVGERKELTDATFGGIPPSMGAEVQKMLEIDRFIGVAYVIEGELYGTSLLALKSDAADPARELLRSFAQMASVSLRRRRAEERMRESERALRESQRRYQTIVESVHDGLTIIEKGKVTYVNNRACEIFGRSRAELLKTNSVDLPAPEEKERLQRIREETISSGKALEELGFWIVQKDGSRRYILNRYSFLSKDGSTRLVASTDITERKGTVGKLETVTQKLQVVGGLTRHDIRNKLSTISSNAFLAKKTLTKGHKALTHLERIESACKQAASILDFAAIYEKLGLEKLTLVDVGTSIDEAVSLFPDMKNVDVVNECHGVNVLADSLLSQLFYNLIDNSLKHGKKVNLIRIRCEIRKKRLKLSYEDNGVGIPEDNKPKLFDEGFSTGNGQGYGLPLIKKMIEVYGWTIEESGEVDKGAKFIIRIPARVTSDSSSPQSIQ